VTPRTRQTIKLVLALLLFAAAGWQFYGYFSGTSPSSTSEARASSPPRELPGGFDLSDLRIDRELIRSGGPPKDGIPSLTEPPTTPVEQADFLDPDDRVVVVSVDGQTRGYPLAVLNWHEAVNDTLGGRPIAVVYCPLCDSASVVDRRIDGQTLEFGISGLLAHSNVLLYDRTDEALWSQVKMEAISGPHAGESLDHLPFELTTFQDLKQQHPQADVVTFDTGHQRNYERNPYQDYFRSDRLYFPVEHDRTLPTKARVIGVELDGVAKAYPLRAFGDDRRIEDTISGQEVVLTIDEHGGVAVEQMPEGAKIVHTFWFAWSAFHPETAVHAAD